METLQPVQEQKVSRIINVLSIAIPVAVAVMLGIRQKIDLGRWTSYLPHINAVINSLTAVLLLLGLYFIRKKNIQAHKRIMLAAFGLGSMFLVCYILYHISHESTPFGGQGLIRPVYYFLLVSHIVLSIVVVWFVLRAVYFALSGQILRHKKTVRYTFPIWLYVSVTGVIVYFLIEPYYLH
jgi:putative membrane protein